MNLDLELGLDLDLELEFLDPEAGICSENNRGLELLLTSLRLLN